MHHSSLSRDRSNFLKSSSFEELEKNGGKMKNHLLLLFTYTLLFVTAETKAFLLSHDLTFRKKETSSLHPCVRA